MRNDKAAALASMIGLSGGLGLPMPSLARKPHWFGVPKDQPFAQSPFEVRPDNSLRYEQIERQRKRQYRLGRKLYGRYRRARDGDRQ